MSVCCDAELIFPIDPVLSDPFIYLLRINTAFVNSLALGEVLSLGGKYWTEISQCHFR
jgi:hypothetical protein